MQEAILWKLMWLTYIHKGATSAEAIYTIITNRSEDTHGPQIIGYNNMQADKDEGTASLNPNSLIGQLRSADPTDSRFTDLFTEADGLVYADKKYPSLDADYIVITSCRNVFDACRGKHHGKQCCFHPRCS